MTVKNILLIDKRVQDYETIVRATDPELCIPVLFDYYTDTINDIKDRISTACESDPTPTDDGAHRCIGLIQHNYNHPFYNLVAGDSGSIVLGVEERDHDLTTWSLLRELIVWCKNNANVSARYFDMMACALYANKDWKYIIDTLEIQTGVTIRASTDDTGAASLGGDWFLESHAGVNLKTVYFTEAIEEYRGLLLMIIPHTSRIYSTRSFAPGNIVAWGSSLEGGVISNDLSNMTNIIDVYSTTLAFAALTNQGQVITWGNTNYGGNSTSVASGLTSGVVAVYSNPSVFAALKTNGSVITWGTNNEGGNSTSVAAGLTSGVVDIYSNEVSFAALKTDGSVISWGNNISNISSVASSLTSGVVRIYSTAYAYAALKSDGSVVTWGAINYGGNSNIYNSSTGSSTSVSSSLQSGVVVVYSNYYAFAALKNDGSVITWGDNKYGGNSSTYNSSNGIYTSVASQLSSGVISIYPNRSAFAALKSNGSVVTWGWADRGGDSTAAASNLSSGVVYISSSFSAFAALKTNGSVIPWGYSFYGGNPDYPTSNSSNLTSNVVSLYSAREVFIALKNNGSLITWGNPSHGGDSSSVASSITSNVIDVHFSISGTGVSALKKDGSVLRWGGVGSNPVAPLEGTLTSGVVTLKSSNNAFVAMKTTATTFDLSFAYYSDMNRYNILRKKENRRRVNFTTLNNNVFTLSSSRDLQNINPNIPLDKPLRIIIPTYVDLSYSITSNLTLPSSLNSFIIACDEGEPVTISGTTYVNYGSYIYRRETNNTYTKLTTTTINGVPYNLYGGDGLYSSGIALYLMLIPVVITNFPTSITKTSVIDASFALVDPSSNSPVAFTYSSSNTSVATVAGNVVTILTPGTTIITVSQAQNDIYASGSATMTLTVVPPNYNGLSIPNSNFTGKNLISATFVGTNLTNSIFTNANLTNVNFTNATIRGVTTGGLTGTSTCTLPSSDYYFKASGSVAGLAGNDTYIIGPYVQITGMDLSNVDISNIPTASFTGLITGGLLNTGSAVLPSGYVFRNGYIVGNGVSLVSAALTGQTFANLSMRSVDLSGATLTSTTFTNTDLSGATIRNTSLSGLNFATASLINLASSGLTGGSGGSAVVLPSGYSILSGSILGPSVNMSSVDLSGITVLSSQSCSSVNFSSANLTNANLSGVNLSNARFTNANLTNANVSGATLTGVSFTALQGIQLSRNPANASVAAVQTALNLLQKSDLRANFSTILADDLLDLSSNVSVLTPTVISGTNQVTLTANPTVAFYMNLPTINVGESYTFTMNQQRIGVINNPSLVTSYSSTTFTVARSLVAGVDTTTVTDVTRNTVVTNTLIRLGNVVYKIHANQGTVIGIPYDINVFKIVNVGLTDILSNNDYLDGRTGVTGPRGITGTSGNVGTTGPTGAATLDGATGPRGFTGVTGQVGETGPQGRDGPTGVDGNTGITGPVGPAGDPGTESGIGTHGPTGLDGETGPTGERGIPGVVANAGPTGLAGTTGATGLSGAIAGIGATGPTGATGPLNIGVWTVINPDASEPTTGFTNIQYSVAPLAEGAGDTRTTTRTTVGINSSGVLAGTTALDIRYTMDISGTIKTVGMNSVSDYRIKYNVVDLPPNKTVDGLRPVKYLNTLSGREEYGFLAHELQSTYPEMVIGNKDDTIGYQTIHYDQLFAIFIAEIKKLRDDIAKAAVEAEMAT